MTIQDAIKQTKYNNALAKSTSIIKPSTITSPITTDAQKYKDLTNYNQNIARQSASTPTVQAIKATAPTVSSMNKQVPTNYASVRDYINNYGQKYGLNNNDIGWVENKNNVGGNVMLKGSYLTAPDIINNGTSYMNQNALKQAIDDYAAKNGLKDMSAQQQAPDTYKSQYTDQIQALLNKLNNQQQFTYNPDADPTFQAYKQQYNREGDRAFKNAIGDMSAITGGQLNSYAASAASQAQNNYSQALMDKLPQLAQMAYSQYQNNDRNNLSALENLDNQDYSKYRNNVSDYINNRNYQNSIQQAIASSAYNNAKLAADNQLKYDTLNANIANNNAKNSIASDKNTITDSNNSAKNAINSYKASSSAAYNQGKLNNDATKINNAAANNKVKNAIAQQNANTNTAKVNISAQKIQNDKTYQQQKNAIDAKYKAGQLSTAQYNSQVNKAYKDASIRIQQQNANTASQNANTNAKNANTNATKATTAAKKTTKTTSNTVGPLYQSMIKSKNPTKWLNDNAQYLTDSELKQLKTYLNQNTKKTSKGITVKNKDGSTTTINY